MVELSPIGDPSMKLPVLTALAVLALAGAGLAQPPPVPIASDFEGATSSPTAYDQLRSHAAKAAPDVLRSVEKAASQVRLACATDRERLCADSRTTFGADRCLDRHRKDLIEPCRAALSQAAMAWNAPR
jgi:hypothetical protein